MSHRWIFWLLSIMFGAACAPSPTTQSVPEPSPKIEPQAEVPPMTPSQAPPPLKANLSTILREGAEFELVSIQPGPVRREEGESVELFRKYRRLGSTKVADEETRTELITALEQAASERAYASKCFNPRHAIRVKFEGATYDLVICFECEQAYAKKGDEMLVEFLVTERHQEVFDKVLREAGVPLAEKAR